MTARFIALPPGRHRTRARLAQVGQVDAEEEEEDRHRGDRPEDGVVESLSLEVARKQAQVRGDRRQDDHQEGRAHVAQEGVPGEPLGEGDVESQGR